MSGRQFFVSILSSFSRTLYIGMTNHLERRLWQHRAMADPGSFTSRYGVTELVHVEPYGDARSAIAREKQLKGWRRAKKLALVEAENPDWRDLSQGWYDG